MKLPTTPADVSRMAAGISARVVGRRNVALGDRLITAHRVALTIAGKRRAKYIVVDSEAAQPVWMNRKQFRAWLREQRKEAQ